MSLLPPPPADPDEQKLMAAKFVVVVVLVTYLITTTIRRFNKITQLYNDIDMLEADINTALGHRRDLLLRARVIAKDFQDHELRMKALRPDTSVVVNTPMAGTVPPPLPMVASSSAGTKADESQHKVQLDLNDVASFLQTKIEKQHIAVKAYRNYCDGFPNVLLAKLAGKRKVEYFKYKEEDSLFNIQDIYAEDRDLHRNILNAAVSGTNGAVLPNGRRT